MRLHGSDNTHGGAMGVAVLQGNVHAGRHRTSSLANDATGELAYCDVGCYSSRPLDIYKDVPVWLVDDLHHSRLVAAHQPRCIRGHVVWDASHSHELVEAELDTIRALVMHARRGHAQVLEIKR